MGSFILTLECRVPTPPISFLTQHLILKQAFKFYGISFLLNSRGVGVEESNRIKGLEDPFSPHLKSTSYSMG